MRSEFAAHAEASQRFLHEARATAKLKHPAIVQLHDFGTTHHGHAFMVMEYLDGASLADWLEERPRLEPVETVQFMLQVLDALTLAHEQGIVHRDLKPENIQVQFTDNTRTCKVMDFGIAKVGSVPDIEDTWTDVSVNSAVQRSVSRLTQLGEIVGSPQYMAPEQARGAGDVDHRADIWSVAVVIYECIAGHRPFDHDHLEQLLLQVLMHAPPCPPEMSPSLWEIISCGMSKNRDQRYQSAEAFGEALAGWLIDQDIDVDASGRSASQPVDGASLMESTARMSMLSLPGAEALDAQAPLMKPLRAKLVGGAVAAVALVALGAYLALSQTEPAADTTTAETPKPAQATVPKPAPTPESTADEPDEPPGSEDAKTPAAPPEPQAAVPKPTAAPKRPTSPPKAPPRPKPAGGLALPTDADF